MSNGAPPIQPAPVPPSVPGVAQPVFGSGSATSPATPIDITGSPLLPPPQVGMDGSVPPAITPAPVPPSVAGVVQPQYRTGSATVPTAASLFPAFTTTPPYPPVVFANIFRIGAVPPPLPSTPSQPPLPPLPTVFDEAA